MDIAIKLKREQALIGEMIALYCKGNHKSSQLCPDCGELKAYAQQRSEHCPHMAEKTFCSNCGTHCYGPEMREKIRAVMRYSGPRILLIHPVLAIKHAYYRGKKIREKDR